MTNHPYTRFFPKTTNPTVNDDETSTPPYEAGDVWINLSTGGIYQCVDPSDGAAVWTTGGGFDLAAAIHAAAFPGMPLDPDDELPFWQLATGGLRKLVIQDIENYLIGTLTPLFVEWGNDTDTDGTLAANSDAKIATQKAVRTFVNAAVTGLLDFKGSTDCSANPNYPSASKGDAYIVSVAGKIGGASGKVVEVGDVYVASADNAGGTEASVGTSWFVLEHNLAGALLSANNLSDLASASSARTNLGLGTAATKNVGTGSGDVAAGDRGVTNGDSHNHVGGDGAPLTIPVPIIMHGNDGTVGASPAVAYATPGLSGIQAVTEFTMIAPFAGTMKNLSIRTSGTQPASGSLVATMRIGGVDSALTVTIAAGSGAGTYSDTTHSVAISSGNLISIRFVNNASAVSCLLRSITMEFDVVNT